MKKLSFWFCFWAIVFFALFLTVSMKPVRAKEKMLDVTPPMDVRWWLKSQTFAFPNMDLNADGKKEKIRLSVVEGGESPHTVKIYGNSGKLIFKADFMNREGCFIGSFIRGPKKQILICEKVEDQSQGLNQPGPFFYGQTVYDWNKKGNLVEAYFYRTKQKYEWSDRLKEFLRNKEKICKDPPLILESVSASDKRELLILGKKWNKYHTTIWTAKRVKDWVLLRMKSNSSPDDWEGELELWQKTSNGWKNRAVFGYVTDMEWISRKAGIPLPIWWKLMPDERYKY